MLKLELVRFSFSAAVTYGVMHSRDGWSCFTQEAVVLNRVRPPAGKAALGEGLYRLRAVEKRPTLWRLDLIDVDGGAPVARIFQLPIGEYQPSDIIIGYSADMVSRALKHGTQATHDLLHMVRNEPETYLNIRHLDNTQLLHFERMAREAIQ